MYEPSLSRYSSGMSRLKRLLHKYIALFKSRPRGTVRTMFSVASLAILLSAALISGTESSYIKLSINKSVVQEGDRISVDVFAFAHVPVNAVDVTLRFDSSAVEVLSVDRGQSVLTIWTEDPIIQEETVVLRGGTFRKGFLGEHKIATVVLRAKKQGQSQFTAENVLLLAGDGSGTPVTLANSNQSNASVFIYDETTDPGNIGVNIAINIITDIDNDGVVSLKDISAFMAAWANKDSLYDFNGDGKMSFRDFSIILADYFLGT